MSAEPTTIDRLASDGTAFAAGIAVPGAVPGDTLVGERVEPGPNRAEPLCPHFGTCGGCLFQHVSDAYLSDWKVAQVGGALAAHGLDAPIRKVHTSAPASRRRATLSGKRTKKGVTLGYHARGSDRVVPVEICPLVRPEIVAAFPALREIARLAASRSSTVKLGVTVTETGLDLAVSGAQPLDGPRAATLPTLASPFARIAWNGEVALMDRAPVLTFGRATVTPPPGAFLQATAEGEAALTAGIFDITDGAREVADLFAGCGTFALPLAQRAEVWAIEGAEEMVAALDAGWRGAERLKTVRAEARDLFRKPLLPAEMKRLDAIVIDPPRAGAAAQIAEIARSDVPTIAHVSCNPGTFARDARTLVDGGYRLDWLEVVDQFRWSPHVELLGRFTRP